MHFDYLINCKRKTKSGSIKLNGKLLMFAGINLFSSITTSGSIRKKNVWNMSKAAVELWKKTTTPKYPYNATITNLFTFIMLNKEYGVNQILNYRKVNSIGIYTAYDTIGRQTYEYTICLKPNKIQPKSLMLNQVSHVTNFVSYYDFFKKILDVCDPPKMSEINTDEINEIISQKYNKLKDDLLKFKVEAIIFNHEKYSVINLKNANIKIGLSEKILNRKEINIEYLKQLEVFEDDIHYINAGIYIEEL